MKVLKYALNDAHYMPGAFKESSDKVSSDLLDCNSTVMLALYLFVSSRLSKSGRKSCTNFQ